MRVLVGFVFDSGHYLHKPSQIGGGDVATDRLLEVHEAPVHAPSHLTARGGWGDHERASILGADLARNEAAPREPIENTRQRRALVREAAVQLGDGRRRRSRKEREDVRFALRQAIVTPFGQVQADPMRRSMNGWDQA